MKHSARQNSRNIFILSFISFLNDIGGEAIKKSLPLFLANTLGAPVSIIGFIEGVADSVPHVFEPLSGMVSDTIQKRKPLVVVGQILRSFVVFLGLATSWPALLLIRFLDRSGKGIANAPRDALLAASSSPKRIGRSFGLSRFFDNAGAVAGLLLASVLIARSGQDAVITRFLFERIVLFSFIPTILAVILVVFLVKEVKRKRQNGGALIIKPRTLGKKYTIFLGISFLFTLGNSSEGFLILKAQQDGIALSTIFLLLAMYSFLSAVFGYLFSSLSDSLGRKRVFLTGWVVYAVVYMLAAFGTSFWAVFLVFVGYGLFGGLTEGEAKAWIADLVPESRRGSAFGLYQMVLGVTLLPASFLAGLLWQFVGPEAPFVFGSVMAGVASVLLVAKM